MINKRNKILMDAIQERIEILKEQNARCHYNSKMLEEQIRIKTIEIEILKEEVKRLVME